MPKTIAIVGAGPIGLACAAELKLRGHRILHFDKGQVGRTIAWFPRGMRFNSSQQNLELLRLPVRSAEGEKPTREDYLAYLRDFVRYHKLDVHTYEEVLSIEKAGDPFRLQTRNKSGSENSYRADRVILALGSTEFPRRLDIPGEDLPHVSHYLDDPHIYHGQNTVIVGGRNSAAEAAIRLTHTGAIVTLVHRHECIEPKYLKYWIGPELMGMIDRGRIQTRFESVIERIEPDSVHLRMRDRSLDRLPCDFVLLLVGYLPDYTLIDMLGIETHNTQRQPVVDPNTLETNVSGVYCVGTLVAGAQNPYRVFIENALDHPYKVADSIDSK